MLIRTAWLAALAAAALQLPARAPDIFFVPTWQPVVYRMLELAEVTSNDVVYDLGSGDGRIVIIAAQKYGARGVGVELDPKLIEVSRQVAREAEISERVTFIQGGPVPGGHLGGDGRHAVPVPERQRRAGAKTAKGAAPRHPHRLAPVRDRPLAAAEDRART
jgi:SAM-dependent methyltransferase